MVPPARHADPKLMTSISLQFSLSYWRHAPQASRRTRHQITAAIVASAAHDGLLLPTMG